MGWAFSLGGSHASCGLQGGHIHKTKPEAEYLIKNRAIWLKGLLWVHCVSSFPSFSLFCFPPFLPPPHQIFPFFLASMNSLFHGRVIHHNVLPHRSTRENRATMAETLRPWANRNLSYFQGIFLSILSQWNKADYQINCLYFSPLGYYPLLCVPQNEPKFLNPSVTAFPVSPRSPSLIPALTAWTGLHFTTLIFNPNIAVSWNLQPCENYGFMVITQPHISNLPSERSPRNIHSDR